MSVPKPPFDPKKPKTASTSGPSIPGTSHSSSSMPQPYSSSAPAAGFVRERKGGGSDSEADEPSTSLFERQMREHVRKKTTLPNVRKLARLRMIDGWQECVPVESPAYFVRGAHHKFRQRELDPNRFGVCVEISHVFIFLRLAGYSIIQTLQIMRSAYIRSRIPAWNAAKVLSAAYRSRGYNAIGHNGIAHFPVQPISEDARLMQMIASDIRSHVANLNRAEHSPPLHMDRFQHLGLYNPKVDKCAIFFEQMIGCYPPRQFEQSFNQYFNVPFERGGCAVDNIHVPFPLQARPLKSHDSHMENDFKSLGSLQSHLFKRFEPFSSSFVPHPWFGKRKGVAPLLARTATPFINLATEDHARTGDPHMMVLDLSDPDAPGIFDPNYGWMSLKQGPCNLALEKVLFHLWEHYTGNRSYGDNSSYDPDGLEPVLKGEPYLYTDQDGNNAFMMATQVFVQTLPAAVEMPGLYPGTPSPLPKRKRSDDD